MTFGSDGSIVSSNGQNTVSLQDEKKSKRVMIFILVAFIFLSLLGILGYVMKAGGFLDTMSFSEYKKLVLFGDTEENIYPKTGGIYAVQDIYFEKERARIEEYFNKIRTSGIKGKSNLKKDVEYINLWAETVLFYKYYDDELIVRYESNGYDGALRYINNKYSRFINSKDEDVAKNGELLVEAEKNYLDYIKEFESNGCKITKLAEGCVNRDAEIDYEFMDSVNKDSLEAFNNVFRLTKVAINDVVVGEEK